ncbi:MAG: hypothetical protein KGO96_09905 [Elusimicrobia bacterium]|nr:hypothetical protein [Elusimicrobiota bacterium]MDE2426203.1 hypothetical protein [Elusimicrobiota bacterium]
MRRQRRLPRLLGAGLLLWISQAFLAPRAGAVQIFIESAFVHRNNQNCVATDNGHGVIRFRCPPLPGTVGCSATTPSCSDTADVGHAGFCSAGSSACGNADASEGPCEQPCDVGVTHQPGFNCGNGDPCATAGITGSGSNQQFGNISNDPEIQFDQETSVQACENSIGLLLPKADGNGPLKPGSVYTNVCNASMFLCASVGYSTEDTTAAVAVDELSFEVFKFQDGSNPLDPASTPPLRTFFIDAPGILPGATTSDASGPLGPFCALWDGSTNIQGGFGKSNGTYGFRTTVQTNQTGASGNIQITQTRAYPSGATRDANPSCAPLGCVVSQQPITVDVTDVHVVRSSPTLVGTITPVPAEPYNIFYRLSKDATAFLTINSVDSSGNVVGPVRHILTGIPRVGEGVPNGSLTNGDSWDGRQDNGDFAPPGVYVGVIQAFVTDQFGGDLSVATTFQIGLDPLKITDIRVQPLLDQATSLAVLDYVLTEPATTYIDIYPPNTQFCKLATNVNDPSLDGGAGAPAKDFQASSGGCTVGVDFTAVQPVRSIVEQKTSRTGVVSFWDGRDNSGNLLGDGNYIFVMYASLPSRNGEPYEGHDGDKRIWTSQAKSGLLPVIRGFVRISQIAPESSVIGSSPAVAGLDPFLFKYSLSRDAIVNMDLYDATGLKHIKTLVHNELRPGGFGNVERWDGGTDDNGFMVSSGTYLVQLTAADPSYPAKVSTTTALFPVDLFRVTDLQSTPLLSGASDFLTVSYQLSQAMEVELNIYPPGTVIKNTATIWPPCSQGVSFPTQTCADITDASGHGNVNPVFSIHGYRSGRLRITEQWDGRDVNGLLLADGQYVFVLVAQSTATAGVGATPYYPTDKTFGTVSIQRGQVLFPSFKVVPDVPKLFNSSNTITLDPFDVDYSLTRESSVTIQILNTNVPPAVVRTLISGQVREGDILLTEVWDGRDDNGNFLPPGFYTVRAVASDLASEASELSISTAEATISYDPLRIYDVAVSPVELGGAGATIFYQVSEPMKVAIKIYKPNTVFDAQGNPTPPESVSLVKRIVGVKPARTQIEDVWDGTDLTLSLVPDGDYKFKIVGSTDVKAIDDLTGNVLIPSELSEDRVIGDIPVVRGASADPQSDFENNSFVFPNPVRGPQATFQVYMPFQGTMKLKIYDVAGELVFEHDFGEQSPSFSSNGPLQFVWNRTNEAGRPVARGIYFAVLRAEETLGGKAVLQTVKKFLIP